MTNAAGGVLGGREQRRREYLLVRRIVDLEELLRDCPPRWNHPFLILVGYELWLEKL